MTIGIKSVQRLFSLALLVLLASGCSMSQMVVRTSMSLMEGSIEAMHRETDLEIGKSAIAANIKMLEGMIVEDPNNLPLRLYAAEGFYGYAFAFVEHESKQRASDLYQRCLKHGQYALQRSGLDVDMYEVPRDELNLALRKLQKKDVPTLFWTASCWAKWIDMNRDDPRLISQLPRTEVLMGRVLELEHDFYYGGAYTFFGVLYGSRPPMLGGDYKRSEEYFRMANIIGENKMLLTDVMHAEYLSRQQLDQETFHRKLTDVLNTPVSQHPELAFINSVAHDRARRLLAQEEELF